MEAGEIKNLMKVCISVLVSLIYSYFITTKIPKGKIRLLLLLPIFYYFTILPLAISSIVIRGAISFFFTWLANFKLLLLCFDKGPLSSNQSKSSLKSFISITCFPIKVKQDPSLNPPQNNIKSKENQLPQQNDKPSIPFAIKVLLLGIVAYAYSNNKTQFVVLQNILFVPYLYLYFEIQLTIAATLARAMLGLELEPPFNEPYLSTSLQDFWGRRWNLMVTSILRPTVYEPIIPICTRFFLRWAPLPGVFMAFVVSGLMHELMFYHMTHVDPTWDVMWFFVLHGVCTALEIILKKALRDRYRLHPWVSRPLTISFVTITGLWLFFPIFMRNGVDVKGIAEFSTFANFVKEIFHKMKL